MVVLGYTPRPYQKIINSGQLKTFYSSGISRLINQVLLDVNTGLYANIAVSLQQLKALGKVPGTLVFDQDLPHIVSTRHLSTIKYPQVITRFNQFLIDKADIIKQLKTRYQVEKILQLTN